MKAAKTILAFLALGHFSFLLLSAQHDRLSALLDTIHTTNDDSLRAASYYECAFLLRLQDLDLAHSYSDSGYYYFNKINNEEGIHLKSYLDATLAEITGDHDQAIEFYQEHYKWAIKTNNPIRQTYALSGLSKSSREKGDLAQAVQYTLRGIELQDSMGLSHENGFFYAELGDFYTKMQLFDQAKVYIQKSYDLAVQTGFALGQSFSLRNLASNASSQLKYDEAIEYILKSIEIDSINQYPNGLSKAHRDLGVVYEKQNDLSRSLHHFNLALQYVEGTDNASDFIKIYQGIARVLLQQNQIEQAGRYLTLADQHLQGLDLLDLEAEQDLLSTEIYERKNQYREAYFAAKSLLSNKNELLNQDIADRITGLNIAFETAQKEQEIELLNAEKELATLQLHASNRRNIGFAVGLGVFCIFSFFLYRLNRKIQTQNQIISKALDEKELLLKEIHHRVKNNLQFISSLLSLQSRHVVDKSAHAALAEGQNRIKSMALIHQNLYQEDNLVGIETKNYLEKLTTDILGTYHVSSDEVHLELEIQDLNLDIDTMIPLGLIVNELVCNSLKHAFTEIDHGRITVALSEAAGSLELRVADNGKGFEDLEAVMAKNSFGYKLVRTLTEQLEGDLTMDGSNGTEVKLVLSNYQKVG